MKSLMKLLVVMMLLLPFTVTSAPVSEFVWTAPGSYDDGSPIQPGDIQTYTIYCGTVPGNYSAIAPTGSDIPWFPINAVVSVDGEYFCAVTATAKGFESPFSEEVHFFIGSGQASVPVLAAPGGLRVE